MCGHVCLSSLSTDAWHKVVKAYPACCLAGGQHTRVQQSCYGFVVLSTGIYYSFATVVANIYMNTISVSPPPSSVLILHVGHVQLLFRCLSDRAWISMPPSWCMNTVYKDPPNSILPEISMHWMESRQYSCSCTLSGKTYLTRLHKRRGNLKKKQLSMAAVVTACRISIEYGFWNGKEKNIWTNHPYTCAHTHFVWLWNTSGMMVRIGEVQNQD